MAKMANKLPALLLILTGFAKMEALPVSNHSHHHNPHVRKHEAVELVILILGLATIVATLAPVVAGPFCLIKKVNTLTNFGEKTPLVPEDTKSEGVGVGGSVNTTPV